MLSLPFAVAAGPFLPQIAPLLLDKLLVLLHLSGAEHGRQLRLQLLLELFAGLPLLLAVIRALLASPASESRALLVVFRENREKRCRLLRRQGQGGCQVVDPCFRAFGRRLPARIVRSENGVECRLIPLLPRGSASGATLGCWTQPRWGCPAFLTALG